MTKPAVTFREAMSRLQEARSRGASDNEIWALERDVHRLLEDIIGRTKQQAPAAAHGWRHPTPSVVSAEPG